MMLRILLLLAMLVFFVLLMALVVATTPSEENWKVAFPFAIPIASLIGAILIEIAYPFNKERTRRNWRFKRKR